jgi:hypothetical protein
MTKRKANPGRKAGERARTGMKRATRQPFHVDKLPPEIQQILVDLHDREGKTWVQIEEQSARPYSKDWAKNGGGFIDWDALETPVLELFPQCRLPKSSLHRWFDVRIEQVRAQVLADAATAREFAQVFTSATIEGGNDAVLNAMRDQVFELARSTSVSDRGAFIEGLNVLTLAMSRLQRVDLMKRKVTVDEKKVEQLVKDAEIRRQKMEAETETLAKKIKNGEVSLDDVNAIRRRTFGLPPIDTDGKVVAA